MRISTLWFAAVMAGISTSAHADSSWRTKAGYPACVQLQTLQEAMMAIVEKDMPYFNSLPNCILTKANIKVRVLKDQEYMRGALRAFQVRAFTGSGKSVVLWIDTTGVDP